MTPFLLQGMAEEQERWISAILPLARGYASGCQLPKHGQPIPSTPVSIFSGRLVPQRQIESLIQISSPFTGPSPGKGSQTSTAVPKARVHWAGYHSPGAAEEVAAVGVQSWRTSSRVQVTSISQGEGPGRESFPSQEVQKVREPQRKEIL